MYKYKVLLFGLTNRLIIYQKYINNILFDYLDNFYTAYLNNIFIYSDDSFTVGAHKFEHLSLKSRKSASNASYPYHSYTIKCHLNAFP
jgi:hypothetical protein